MFYFNGTIILILQAICVIHCLRKGRPTMWIWLIIFLPVIGAIIYIFSEMLNGNEIKQVQSGVGAVFNPGGRIKKLEEQLRFSDTFNNRVTLADAYLATGETEKAIELYENSLTGAFTENEHVLMQLSIAYFETKQYDKVIAITKKIYRLPQFPKSKAHIIYALSLEQTGNSEQAEKEFRSMKVRFSYFESRYEYGLFLERANRSDEAKKVFADIVDESTQLSPREKRNNREWINKAKEELKKVPA